MQNNIDYDENLNYIKELGYTVNEDAQILCYKRYINGEMYIVTDEQLKKFELPKLKLIVEHMESTVTNIYYSAESGVEHLIAEPIKKPPTTAPPSVIAEKLIRSSQRDIDFFNNFQKENK